MSDTLTGPGYTPNPDLKPLDPSAPKRKMQIEIEVAADFERRLDNQWMVEREIHADRWSWKWAGEPTEVRGPVTNPTDLEEVVNKYLKDYQVNPPKDTQTYFKFTYSG